MNHSILRPYLLFPLLFFLIGRAPAPAQPSFRVPLYITDSTGWARVDTTIAVFIGIHPSGTGCANINLTYTGFVDHWDLSSFYPWNTAVSEPMPPDPFVVARILAHMLACGDFMTVQIKSRPLVDTFGIQVVPTDTFKNSIKYYSWPDPAALQQYCDSMILAGTVAVYDSADVQVRRPVRVNMTQVPFYRAVAYPPSLVGSYQTQLLFFRVFIYGPKTPAITPPATVQLISPASGDTTATLAPTLSWNPVADIDRYYLQVSTDSTFNRDSVTSFVFNDTLPASATSRSIAGLIGGKKYYWSVYGVNKYGYSYPLSPLWWFRTQVAVGVGDMPPWIPSDYGMAQNYPNPFNSGTEIRYWLPVRSYVTLRIYSVLGELVSTLVRSDQSPGGHTIHWDGGNLAGGVYYYRLEAGPFTETKRMVLVK